MPASLEEAPPEDADVVAELRNAAADDLTAKYGSGHWSFPSTADDIMKRMKSANVFLLRQRGKAIATLCLAEKKPWSIDPSYFSKAKKPLYLVGMAVAPEVPGQGNWQEMHGGS